MGSESFRNGALKNEYVTSPHTAFSNLRSDAIGGHGSSGYTGTIAEKDSFIMRNGGDPVEASELGQWVRRELDDEDDGHDKWGPAWAVPVSSNGEVIGWAFYGYASS